MRVHLYARPVEGSAATPPAALRGMAKGLQSIGVDAAVDHATVARSRLSEESAQLRDRIRRSLAGRAPDVVHAHGRVAAVAALAACHGRVPVVVTFDEERGPTALEAALGRRTSAVVVRSTAEREVWTRHRMPIDHVHVVPLTAEVAESLPAQGAMDVVTDARAGSLDRVLRSVPLWPADRRLVILSELSRVEKAHALGLAAGLGVADRVEVNPLLREATRRLWSRAALVVATERGARHGDLVIDAAAHGVPSVAAEVGAHCDVVVVGATGVLVPVAVPPLVLGRVVADLLRDPLRLRGYGLAAQLRAGASHQPEQVARRAVDVFEAVLERRPDAAPRESSTPDRLRGYRADLVVENLPVARRIAQRYAGRGQSIGDLVQVASLGLVKAARRYEPEQGTDFLSYAVPTMLGELRRYFRDNAWAMHVPRGLQETALRVQQADETLRQDLGHDASAAELAGDLGVSVDEILEARQVSGTAFSVRSLDAPLRDEAGNGLADLVGDDDVALEDVEDRQSLSSALARVPEREREILVLRYFGERTQTEIAERLGISQMHVSRLLSRTLRVLREHVVDGAPLPESWAPASVAPASVS